MANVLKNETKQQVLALGRLGWSLRRIQEATHVRRETISAYLKASGIAVWPPGGWDRQGRAKPAIQVTTGSDAAFGVSKLESRGDDGSQLAKPAIEVTTGSDRVQAPVVVSDEIETFSSKGKAKTAKPAIQV